MIGAGLTEARAREAKYLTVSAKGRARTAKAPLPKPLST
jgi:hypothetical protein